MDQPLNKDIERMITFINHEVEEKIKEIELKGIQDYNIQKAQHIQLEMDNIEKTHQSKKKDLLIKKLKTESNIVLKYNMKYLDRKNEIVEQVFKEVLNGLINIPLSEYLLQDSVRKMTDKEYTVICKKEDKKVVKKVLGSVDIKVMNDIYGGVVIVSSDRKTIVDNSYKSRLDIIRRDFMSDVYRGLINKC